MMSQYNEDIGISLHEHNTLTQITSGIEKLISQRINPENPQIIENMSGTSGKVMKSYIIITRSSSIYIEQSILNSSNENVFVISSFRTWEGVGRGTTVKDGRTLFPEETPISRIPNRKNMDEFRKLIKKKGYIKTELIPRLMNEMIYCSLVHSLTLEEPMFSPVYIREHEGVLRESDRINYPISEYGPLNFNHKPHTVYYLADEYYGNLREGVLYRYDSVRSLSLYPTYVEFLHDSLKSIAGMKKHLKELTNDKGACLVYNTIPPDHMTMVVGYYSIYSLTVPDHIQDVVDLTIDYLHNTENTDSRIRYTERELEKLGKEINDVEEKIIEAKMKLMEKRE